MVGKSGNIATSIDDGKTWSSQSVSRNWQRVAYGDGRWVAVGDSGIAIPIYSTSWINKTVGSLWLGNVCGNKNRLKVKKTITKS